MGCGRCSLVCSHGSIRIKIATEDDLKAAGANDTFKTADANGKKFKGRKFTLQVSTADCAGCGETPYIKLVTQLFGDRMMVANATGCSSIYGGNLPTTPYAQRADGRGPSWSNSLFEDNAEYGLGMRQSANKLGRQAAELLEQGLTHLDPPAFLLPSFKKAQNRIYLLEKVFLFINGDNEPLIRGQADGFRRRSF